MQPLMDRTGFVSVGSLHANSDSLENELADDGWPDLPADLCHLAFISLECSNIISGYANQKGEESVAYNPIGQPPFLAWLIGKTSVARSGYNYDRVTRPCVPVLCPTYRQVSSCQLLTLLGTAVWLLLKTPTTARLTHS